MSFLFCVLPAPGHTSEAAFCNKSASVRTNRGRAGDRAIHTRHIQIAAAKFDASCSSHWWRFHNNRRLNRQGLATSGDRGLSACGTCDDVDLAAACLRDRCRSPSQFCARQIHDACALMNCTSGLTASMQCYVAVDDHTMSLTTQTPSEDGADCATFGTSQFCTYELPKLVSEESQQSPRLCFELRHFTGAYPVKCLDRRMNYKDQMAGSYRKVVGPMMQCHA